MTAALEPDAALAAASDHGGASPRVIAPPAITVSRSVWIPVLLIAHMGAALYFDDHPSLAALHAYLTLLAGLWVCLLGTKVDRVIYIASYIVGAEVLWRMAGASIYWEFGKYAVSLLLLLSLFRFFRQRRGLAAPLLFLVALTPSVFLAFQDPGPNGLRDALSFNLSGPLSLAVAVMFFRQVRVTAHQANTILWALVIPIAGIAARTLQGIVTSDRITFTNEASFEASAGFGPNQVSSLLGLGALAAIFLVSRENRAGLKFLSLGLFFWFVTQSFLTFSRGGIYSLVIASGLALLAMMRASGRRVGPVALAIVIAAVMGWVILPRLEEFTQDQLAGRFSSLETTQRTELAAAELKIWATNPLTGVGPGGITTAVERAPGEPTAAHTEFTRLLAEHGVGGVLALFLLAVMLRAAWKLAATPSERAWMVAFSIWTVVEMAHSAMRLAAIGFCFGLAAARTHHRASEAQLEGP